VKLRLLFVGLLIVLLFAGVTSAGECNSGIPARFIVLSGDSDVYVTFTGASAMNYNSYGLSSPTYMYLGNEGSPHTPINIGHFPAGTELIFWMKTCGYRYDDSSNCVMFYTGPASRNAPYNHVMALIAETAPQQWAVEFEDNPGGDWDCNDFTFKVQGNLAIDTNVNTPPEVSVATSFSGSEGVPVTFAATASDSDGDTLTYLWDFGDGYTSSEQNPTHAYANDGEYMATLTVSDGTVTVTKSIPVSIANAVPSVNAGSDGVIGEGGTFTSSGYFTDLGTDSWSATVDYGDGTGSQPLALNPDKTFALSHIFVNDGIFTITVTVNDGTGSGSDTASVTVDNVPPSVTTFTADKTVAKEGETVKFTLVFTDPGTDTWSLLVDYHDGSAPETLPVDSKTFEFSHTFIDDSTGASITISDGDGGSADASCSVKVENVAPDNLALTLNPVTAIKENDDAKLSGTFTDPGTADTHVVDIAWGDGTTTSINLLAGVLTFGPTSHQYLDDPSDTTDVYTISVKVTDKDTEFDEATQAITVNNVAPTVDAGADATINEGSTFTSSGSFTDPGTLDTWTAKVNYGDGSGDQVLTLTGKTFSLSHVFADNAAVPYTVTVTVTDKDGGVGSDTAMVTVNNVPPTVTEITNVPIDPVASKSPTGITGTFTDPGTKDTHTATWSFVAFDTTSTCAGIVTESGGSGSISVNSACIIPPNVYDSITLTVTDKDGGIGTKTVETNLVIYDPNGGFVTGGGWINSLAGNYAPDPSLYGKATFGFVSKYQKGATVPTGNTQFVFHVAKMEFHSSNYQWLVVAGAKAMYKGTGTIDNKGNYGFLLSAIDGQVKGGGGTDKFRIKIWDKNNNDAVVYDNQMGAAEDGTPTTAIDDGSIVIHA
jgi:hypothetical protein